MEVTPALVITRHELKTLMDRVAVDAASKVLTAFKDEFEYDPDKRIVDQLRRYLDDRTTVAEPREVWAHGKHIRAVMPNGKGKARSATWFQQFKRESGLAGCPTRTNKHHGRLQEWCFADIANAWDQYYVLR